MTRLVYQKAKKIKRGWTKPAKTFQRTASTKTSAVTTHVSGNKWVQSTGLDIVNGSLCVLCNLCALALVLALHIFATQCSDTSFKKDKTAVHCCDSCHVWCLETSFT